MSGIRSVYLRRMTTQRKEYFLGEVFDLPPSLIKVSDPDFHEAYDNPYHVLFNKTTWCKKHFKRRCDASRFARKRSKEVYNWYTW